MTWLAAAIIGGVISLQVLFVVFVMGCSDEPHAMERRRRRQKLRDARQLARITSTDHKHPVLR